MQDEVLYLTTAGGRLLSYNIDEESFSNVAQILPEAGIHLMGIARHSDRFYISSDTTLFQGHMIDGAFVSKDARGNPNMNLQFHHMKIITKQIFIANTLLNGFDIFDLDLKFLGRHILSSGDSQNGSNHINLVRYHDGYLYVVLNQLSHKFGMSGVAVLTKDLKEIERYTFGWQSHGLVFIDGDRYTLCNCANYQLKYGVQHPEVGGLMVENDLKFEYGTDWFCKDFSMNDEKIFIVGGSCKERDDRSMSDGVIFIMDRDFKNVKKITSEGSGEFRGCLLSEKDLTE